MKTSKKKFIGKLISIKYTDRPTPIEGFVIDYNDDWTLLKYNHCDYEMDGYVLLRHKNIEGYRREAAERFTEKVIMNKGQHTADFTDFPLTDLKEILSTLSKRYGIFHFELKSEKSAYLGKLKSINSSALVINYITPKAVWARTMTFRPNDVRVIYFDNDYCNSLLLYSKKGKKKVKT